MTETRQQLEAARAEVAELSRAVDEEIAARDAYMDWADRLAYAIGSIDEIGEHTSGNDPWENALELLPVKLAAARADEREKIGDLIDSLVVRHHDKSKEPLMESVRDRCAELARSAGVEPKEQQT